MCVLPLAVPVWVCRSVWGGFAATLAESLWLSGERPVLINARLSLAL